MPSGWAAQSVPYLAMMSGLKVKKVVSSTGKLASAWFKVKAADMLEVAATDLTSAKVAAAADPVAW